MNRSHVAGSFRAMTLVAIILVLIALSACGGSGTTESSSLNVAGVSPSSTSLPSASPGQAAASPSTPATTPPSATPLPTPTVAGTIVFARAVRGGVDADICVVESDGTGLKTLAGGPDWQERPSWSPDGSRIVYAAGPAPQALELAIWTMNADGSEKVRLTAPGKGLSPCWSPDGKWMTYGRWVSWQYKVDVLVMRADGTGRRDVLHLKSDDEDPTWTADGRIVFLRNGDLFVVEPDGSGLSRLTSGEDIRGYAPSPDAGQVALHDYEGDRLVIVSASGGGARTTVLDTVSAWMPDDIYAQPAWSPDGKALAVASTDYGLLYGSPLFIINADGSGLSAVPGIDNAMDPAWRPE
jgi:Tol biopolymer transport system component